MRTLLLLLWCALFAVFALLAGCAAAKPDVATAQAESAATTAFLERLTGDWSYDSEAMIDPTEPWAQGTGESSGRMLGQWIVFEGRDTTSPAHPMTHMLRIGYDAHERRIVASWVDSVQTMRWSYSGTLEGDVLTLEAVGPNPADRSKSFRYRHVITITGPDAHTGASAVRMKGEWVEFARYHYTRKTKTKTK